VLLERLGIEAAGDHAQRADLTETFASRTRDARCELREGSDACFAPVLSLGEAPEHPHNVRRGAFAEIEGVVQPAPAPRYSETPNAAPAAPRADAEGVLGALGYAPERIAALRAAGTIN
jgi:alpha-methylacyl-CoA racemase